MPKAGEVAAELRRIADALDKEPETLVDRPLLFFSPDAKQMFLDEVRLFPKPLQKSIEREESAYPMMVIENPQRGPFVWLRSSIPRDLVCRVVRPAQPAEYDCEPLLSQSEEDSLIEEEAAR